MDAEYLNFMAELGETPVKSSDDKSGAGSGPARPSPHSAVSNLKYSFSSGFILAMRVPRDDQQSLLHI